MTAGEPRTAVRRQLQLAVLGLSAALTIGAAIVLGGAAGELLASLQAESPVLVLPVLLQPVWLVSVALVAILLNIKRPSNRIGWLFVLVGPLLGFVTGVWSFRWPVPVGWEPEYAWLSVVASFYVVALIGPGLALLFPDGRLPSHRWRWPVGTVGTIFLVSAFVAPLAPGYLAETMPPQAQGAVGGRSLNDFGVAALEPFGELLNLASLGSLLMLLGIAIASLVVRIRHGGPVVRAQLRWLLLAISLIGLGMGLAAVESLGDPAAVTFGVVFVFLGFALTPVAVAVAILRYRLYEIDVIIRRTLVYGALSAVLGGVYIIGVLVLQALLSPLTGGDALAVAASTLAVAALFQPLRRRLQRAVDRRFYRSRYDAARTLTAFGARLRDQVDLGQLTDELEATVQLTMQPSSASVWIRSRP